MTSPTSNILGPLEVFNYPVFGCGNKTFRCNHSDLPVPPDPDIAGLGALIAFSSTSIFTLFAVTLAYLLGVIPQMQEVTDSSQLEQHAGLLNDLDACVIKHLQDLFRLRYLCGWLSNYVNGFHSLQRFMLALSDQQIVTGLAIFIIGFSKHCELSSYHFIVIMALGWFSFTTHLSTLTVLQGYLVHRPGQKLFRLGGIVATFLLLSISFVLLYSRPNNDIAVQCRFARIGLSGATKLRAICAILLLIFLSTMFLSKTARFCFGRRSDLSSLRRMVWSLISRRKLDAQYRQKYFKEMFDNVEESRNPGALKSLRRSLLSFDYVILEYLDSFCWELSWLFFSNFYGIRQIWWAREFVGAQVMSKESRYQQNKSTFGQILALLLLATLVLVAIEAIQGSKHNKPPRRNLDDVESPVGGLPEMVDPLPLLPAQLGEKTQTPASIHERIPNFRIIFACIFMYTQATLCIVAWFIGGPIDDRTAPGVITAIFMSLGLLIATISPFVEEVRARNHAEEIAEEDVL